MLAHRCLAQVCSLGSTALAAREWRLGHAHSQLVWTKVGHPPKIVFIANRNKQTNTLVFYIISSTANNNTATSFLFLLIPTVGGGLRFQQSSGHFYIYYNEYS